MGKRGADAGFGFGLLDLLFNKTIIVVGHEVARPNHPALVCFTTQNFQPAEAAPRLIIEASKDPVSSEEKILSKNRWKSCGAKVFCPDQGDGDKAHSLKGIECQSLIEERLENTLWKGEGNSHDLVEESNYGKGMPLEKTHPRNLRNSTE